jgi:hypothetical protein
MGFAFTACWALVVVAVAPQVALAGDAGPMGLVAEIWRRATSRQTDPPAAVVALMAVLALLLVLAPRIWPVTRMLVTIAHEGAHAVVAVLVGRRLQGIRLHTDTSGLTLSRGRPRGPGMVAMLAAGYLGPALVGLAATAMLGAGYSLGLLWCYLVLLVLLLLQIRNFYGLLVVLGAAVGVAVISWYLTAPAQAAIAYLTTWVLLLAAPKPVLELAAQRRRGRGSSSDVDQLARLTHLPAVGWLGFFLVANLVGLAFGSALLLPALAHLAETVASSLRG